MQHMKGQEVKVSSSKQSLLDKKVKDLMKPEKRRLVEVPYKASLSDTMNILVANKVVAVPVAAPPGHWIGAGGSMIMEYDKQTGSPRKHYIGMVTMIDILAHIADDEGVHGTSGGQTLEQKMAVEVFSIIGHCLEGLSLWTLNPNTSILDCMEVLSKGIHRVMVPVDSHMANVCGIELMDSASSYRMLTQMDVLGFIREHFSELEGIISRSVRELNAVSENVFAITDRTSLIHAIKGMRAALLNAVPIVKSMDSPEEDHAQLVYGKGRQLIGTFSATDLRGCHLHTLQSWLPKSAFNFTEEVSKSSLLSASTAESPSSTELVTCRLESTLAEVIEKAVTKHVHRIWIMDNEGLLLGLVSLTDIIKVLRSELLLSSTAA